MDTLIVNPQNISTEKEFEKAVSIVYKFQLEHNPIYREYNQRLNFKNSPLFLPIRFFKHSSVKSTSFTEEAIFTSSGTTGISYSKHFVKSLDIYRRSFIKAFELFYGAIDQWCIVALLPSYLERKGSSLVFMVEELIQRTQNSKSGFYLNNYQELADTLKNQELNGQKTLLLGVSYALLDFSGLYPMNFKYTYVMETGGMKGRGPELTKQAMHSILKERWNLDSIQGEYGMTELLSQAYSKENGRYKCPPWMKVLIRDLYDPFKYVDNGKIGVICIIDLANIYSCSFIETQDLGKINDDETFEVLGRVDNSDIRGCNLLVQ